MQCACGYLPGIMRTPSLKWLTVDIAAKLQVPYLGNQVLNTPDFAAYLHPTLSTDGVGRLRSLGR